MIPTKTTTKSRPSELIRIKLEFFKLLAAANTAQFSFELKGIKPALIET